MCNQLTNHDIIYTHTKDGNDGSDYWRTHFHIVQCAGCEIIAFVKQSGTEDSIFLISGEKRWEEVFDVYPQPPENKEFDPFWGIEKKYYGNVPNTIEELYSQIIDVYSKEYFLLTMIGIRTIIEAICLDVGITHGLIREENQEIKLNRHGKEVRNTKLEGKIYGLFDHGMIIWDQTLILQKIRELGNAAVHEIKPPSVKILKSAIEIIEQLLTNVYELKVHKLLKKKFKRKEGIPPCAYKLLGIRG